MATNPATAAPAKTGGAETQPKANAKAAPTQAYKVLAVAVRHDGQMYEVGSTMDLTEAQAERLGGLVAPVAAKPAAAEQAAAA